MHLFLYNLHNYPCGASSNKRAPYAEKNRIACLCPLFFPSPFCKWNKHESEEEEATINLNTVLKANYHYNTDTIKWFLAENYMQSIPV